MTPQEHLERIKEQRQVVDRLLQEGRRPDDLELSEAVDYLNQLSDAGLNPYGPALDSIDRRIE